MKPFPFIPLGEAIVCKKISTDITRGGVIVPESLKDGGGDAIVVCEVISIPKGGYLQTGERIPCEVSIGDHVAIPMKAARKISIAVRDQLVMRGVDEKEINDMFVAFIPTVLGISCKIDSSADTVVLDQ